MRVFFPPRDFSPGNTTTPIVVVSAMRMWYYLLLHPVVYSPILNPWQELSYHWLLIVLPLRIGLLLPLSCAITARVSFSPLPLCH